MDALKAFVTAMFNDAATNWAIVLLIVLPGFDWLLGVLRAIADKTFAWSSLDVFVRKTIAGRVIPIILLLVLGRFIAVGDPGVLKLPGVDLNLIALGGFVAAGPFIAATMASILSSATQADKAVPTG